MKCFSNYTSSYLIHGHNFVTNSRRVKDSSLFLVTLLDTLTSFLRIKVKGGQLAVKLHTEEYSGYYMEILLYYTQPCLVQ